MLLPFFVKRQQGARFDHAAWKQALSIELGPSAANGWERAILDGQMFVPEAGAFGPRFTRVAKSYTVDGRRVDGYAWARVLAAPAATCRKW